MNNLLKQLTIISILFFIGEISIAAEIKFEIKNSQFLVADNEATKLLRGSSLLTVEDGLKFKLRCNTNVLLLSIQGNRSVEDTAMYSFSIERSECDALLKNIKESSKKYGLLKMNTDPSGKNILSLTAID